MNVVDIIVPAYRGLEETRACLESVLAGTQRTSIELVVVDDASPEPGIPAMLDALAATGRITLLRNNTNRGFVASVNRAMALHPERDVVLLNSDTEVHADWVDRLLKCAGSDPHIASVNPFSNNATLASYPSIGADNPLPAGWTAAALDALMAKTNAGQSVAVPTTVGFCMLLRRAALAETGLFDEEAFGRGYGEENDWCVRAAAKGFSHCLCGDTFVLHRGEVSFGADAKPGQRHAQSVIDARYPQYREWIAQHFANDPARPMRANADLARLAASPRQRLLFVTHQWGGGTEKHVQDLAHLVKDHAEVLVLRPRGGRQLELQWLRKQGAISEPLRMHFDLPDDEKTLRELLASLSLARLHIHHVHQQPAWILTLASQLGVPLDVTLHDYFPITPQYHLSPGAEVPDADVPNHWGLSLKAWRAAMLDLLAGADRVICPSQDLRDRLAPFLPGVKLDVWLHPEPSMPAVRVPHKVLILGGLTVEKGLDVVRACAADARDRSLPLHFHVIGHSEHVLDPDGSLPATVYGSYAEADLPQLIGLAHGSAFLFPAQIPESYSYTLTAAMRTGLPVVASQLGSFTERLAGYTGASLVVWNAEARHWNEALLAAVGPAAAGSAAATGSAAEYAARYLAPLATAPSPSGARVAPAVPRLPGRLFYPGKQLGDEPEKTLTQLLVGGVECGHGPTRDELKRRAVVFDAELREARQSAAAAHEALQRMEAEYTETIQAQQAALQAQDEAVAAARAAYLSIEESTSWRLTAPLRSLMQGIKDLRHRVSDLRGGLRRLPRDAAIAGQILKEEGVVALGRRVHGKLTRRSDFMPAGRIWELESAVAPLMVPFSDTPRWSLIIPVYQQHLLTFTCLKSIAETCTGQPIEVIVVDDCSPEPVAQALAMVSGIRITRNDTNLGFLRNCNKAAATAKGEFVVILNNDLILTGDWLRQMSAVFVRRPNTGLVGAKLIYPDGKLQEAGGIVWRDGSAWNVGRGDDPEKPEYAYLREVDYCSGACLMMRRELWDELGGFDEAYAPAYYEDTDLAFRVREKGLRVVYQPHAVVVHFEGRSSGTDVTQGVKRHQVSNQKTFAERWEARLASHRVNGMSPRLEKDRRASRRVLVIDACMLTPDQDAGSMRMFEMLGVMCTLGCKVTFVASNLEYRLPYVRDIQALGVEVLHHPYVKSVSAVISEGASEYDVVMLSRATVAMQYVDQVRQCIPRAKLVFDTVDLHFLRQTRQAELSGDAAQKKAADAMKTTELDIIGKSDVTLVVSDFEQKLLEELAPRSRIRIVATISEPMPGPASFAERSGLIFIGGFRHPPNLDAVTWYAENVLPILRRDAPGLVTTIIGSNAPPALEEFAAPDFVIAGFIPDIAPFYEKARLSISPLRYGAGVKGKVNLAMQYGVPVVATPLSVEGMFLTHEKDVLVADTAEAFAAAIIRTNSDAALWARLRTGGLENIEAHFSRATARRALAALLDLDQAKL